MIASWHGDGATGLDQIQHPKSEIHTITEYILQYGSWISQWQSGCHRIMMPTFSKADGALAEFPANSLTRNCKGLCLL